MTHYLAEDPWPLVIALGVMAVGFLIAMKLSQQGVYLVLGLLAAALALAVLAVEHYWVTDNERIETVIEDLAHATSHSDADAVLAHLAPEVSIAQNQGGILRGPFARAAIGAAVKELKFDFIHVSKMEANAGAQSRQGTAEFRVHASGSYTGSSFATMNFATPGSGTDWSLGLRETEPGVWKVTRITPTRLPQGYQLPLGGARETR